MARINYGNRKTTDGRLRELLEVRPDLNIYKMLSRGGVAAEGFLELGSRLLGGGSLDPMIRELIILRVGILSHAKYEVHQHTRIAHAIGMADEKIRALYDGPEADIFNEDEKIILRYVDELVLKIKTGESIFRQLEELFNVEQLIEIHILVGFYMLVVRFLESFDIEIEDINPPMKFYSSVRNK